MAGGSQYIQRIFENVGMDANRVSPVIETFGKEYFGVQLDWGAGAQGDWQFEGSLNYGSQGSVAKWTVFTLATPPKVPALAADSELIDLTFLPWPYLRITFLRTAGTAADLLNGWVGGKGE